MKLYIGNVAPTTTEQMLRTAFATHGTVNDCRIPTDRTTGVARGFGIVEMAKDAEATKAIEAINNTELGGQTIEVRESHKKPDQKNGEVPKGKGNNINKSAPEVVRGGDVPEQKAEATAPDKAKPKAGN